MTKTIYPIFVFVNFRFIQSTVIGFAHRKVIRKKTRSKQFHILCHYYDNFVLITFVTIISIRGT